MDADERKRRLVADVSAVVNDIFKLNCCGLFEAPAVDQSFLSLLLREDGSALTHVEGVSSLYERRSAESARRRIHARLEALAHFTDLYRFLLSDLTSIVASCSHSDQAVDLMSIVASASAPSGGYFLRVSIQAAVRGDRCPVTSQPSSAHGADLPLLTDDVCVGGFCCELARLLEAPVEAWLAQCEKRIEALFAPRASDGYEDDGGEGGYCGDGGNGVPRRKELRRRLGSIFSQHIAMVGLYATSGPELILERSDDRDQYFVGLMEQLAADFSNDAVREACVRRREVELGQLRLLRVIAAFDDGVSRVEDAEALARRVAEQRHAFLRVLKRPPDVLVRRPGFHSVDWRFVSLGAIVRNTQSSSLSLTAVQLQEWRHAVGRDALGQLTRLIDQAEAVLARQTFPGNGFLPTLRLVQPPPPTWTDPAGADAAYAHTLPTLPMATPVGSEQYLQMPPAVEKMLRLISLVWEMLAYDAMRSFFFLPGVVSARHLREIVSVEQVSVAFAATVLNSWRQRANWGCASRDAAVAISRYRGADFEDYLRSSVARLRHWSLGEVMSVVSEAHSPTFLQTKWQLVDAVAQHVVPRARGERIRCSSALGHVLDLVEPIVVELRGEAGLAMLGTASARHDAFAALLRSIPAVRRWDGRGSELLLSVADVRESKNADARPTLDELAASSSCSLVTFGRVGKAAGFGAKRVFRLGGADLRSILFNDEGEEEDGGVDG